LYIDTSSAELLEQSLRMPGFRVESERPAQVVEGYLLLPLHQASAFASVDLMLSDTHGLSSDRVGKDAKYQALAI
jgi:hypothetical protein